MDLSQYETLGDDAHINLRTFRQDGTHVDTPVWFDRIDGNLYLRTVSSSAKIQRILQHPAIEFAPCRWDGEVTGHWQAGRARVMEPEDPLIADLDERMDRKYGDYRREMTELMAGLGKTLCFVEITPVAESH